MMFCHQAGEGKVWKVKFQWEGKKTWEFLSVIALKAKSWISSGNPDLVFTLNFLLYKGKRKERWGEGFVMKIPGE